MDDAAQGRNLTGMPRGMLGRVKDQTDDGRWQPLPADDARFCERVSRRRANLRQRRVDRRVHLDDERSGVEASRVVSARSVVSCASDSNAPRA